MNICMVGTGYVGLVTGACLADFGKNVVCVDKDAAKIAALQRGEIPIYEPGLEEIVAQERAGRAPALHDGPQERDRAARSRSSSPSARRPKPDGSRGPDVRRARSPTRSPST